MRKRTKFKSPVLDTFVVLLTLSVAAYFGYTFWKDLNSTATRSDKEKIAIITFKNRIAQRKFDDRVVWERIDKSTPLYNGDLVRTADLAEAVITFNDGSEVNIYENTMIQVYYSEFEGVQIDVDSGNLQLESSDKGKVQLTLNDGSKVSAGGGTSLSTNSKSGSGSSTVAVRNGFAQVTGSSGQSEAINSGETLSVKENGAISKKPVTVVSIPPELKVLNVEGGDVPVKLEWNSSDQNQPIVVQTSKKKDFSKILEEKTVLSKSDSLVSVSEGTLYWRVFQKGHEDEASQGKISVADAKPLTLLSPTESGTIKFRNRNPVLNFRWEGNDYAKQYLVQVSSTPDMKNPVAAISTENTSIQLDTLGSGEWWWQVTPYYELNSIGYTGSSAIASFNIEKTEGLAPPLLSVPLQNADIHYKESPDVNFSWKSDVTANYELLISEDKDFKDILLRRTTAFQRLKLTLPQPASDGQTYYWKIIRSSSDPEDLTPESDVRSFVLTKYVSVPTKLLYPPEDYSTEVSKLASTQFVWKPSDEARNKESVLQISASRNFDSLRIEKKLLGTSVDNLTLPYGDWYWRVANLDSDGDYEYTEPRHLTVLKELEAPAITNVKDEAELVVAKNGTTKFSWLPVIGADYYNVRIFDSKNILVAENAKAVGTSAAFKLPDDTYSIRIQAVASQTDNSPLRTGPVQEIDFSVRTPEAIKTLSPAPSAQIEGLSALRTPVTFSWKAGKDKPVSTELVIKKRQNDGSVRIVERLNTTKNQVSIPRLNAGSYSWQINASTQDGFPINSNEVNFTITPVALLDTPKLQAPAKNFVLDSAYLRKNRSLSFEWAEVPGATEYNFVIYRKEKNGRLVSVYSENKIKGNKIRFKNLSVLDIGNFEWNVTAYSFAKDGYEERRSPVAQGSFSVKIETPKQITTEKTGRMYIGK